MKMIVIAAFSTALVITVGFIIVSPMFFRTASPKVKQQIMLTFSVLESNDSVEWCKTLSSILQAHDIGATVFFVGRAAEQHPECVASFNGKVDIGSQTYSNSNLTAIIDYSLQLEEVRKGKIAVDTAGNLYSRVFRAPNGATDQNIYSLLSRNDIWADFSYSNQYNVYLDNQFVRFDASTYDGGTVSADAILALEKTSYPIIVHFDSGCSTQTIANFIAALDAAQFDFVNASEITGVKLTERGD